MDDEALKHFALHNVERLKELHAGKRFHQAQVDVFDAIFKQNKKRIFIRKGRKGGGTETVLYPLVRIAGTKPGASCYMIGPTEVLQAEICWDNRRLHNFIPKSWNPQFNEQRHRVRLPNESFIKINGSQDLDGSRGWEGDIFVWDEYKDQNPIAMENCYPNVLSRDAIWIVLGTPPTKRTNHYYIKEREIRQDPDWAFFHWTAWDNPFLPGGHEFLKKEKEKYIARGDWDLWDIEYEAKYVFNANRKVIPAFNEKNIRPRADIMAELSRDKKHLKWITWIDPGYSTCFAVLFAVINPYTNQIFWLDEIYSTDRRDNSARDMWPLIRRKQKNLYDGRWITGYDNAGAGFAVEVQAIMRDTGERGALVPTVKQIGDEDGYFRTLNSIFALRGQSYVASECKQFIWEMEEYETDEKDNYPDAHNHLLDDARYILKYANFTPGMKQLEVKREKPLPVAESLEQAWEKDANKKDVAGFGGFEAAFDIGDI